MSSNAFHDKIRFWPSPHKIGYKCEKRIVSLQIDGMRKDNDDNVYEEWVIKCKAVVTESNVRVAYYISRGYEQRKGFVYKFSSGKFVLDHECSNVSLLN